MGDGRRDECGWSFHRSGDGDWRVSAGLGSLGTQPSSYASLCQARGSSAETKDWDCYGHPDRLTEMWQSPSHSTSRSYY